MSAPSRRPLTVAVAQPVCLSYDVAANAIAHATAIRAAVARVVVFPELSLTGYEVDAPPITTDDPRLAPMMEACAETGTFALAGAPTEDAIGGRHLSVIAIDGDRSYVAYSKMWLGGDEPKHFEPGTETAVVEVDGWRLGLAICKDTGVTQHATDTAAHGMDVYVAGVLETADNAAVTDERARRVAADHHVPVAVASFAGSTGGGYAHAAGRSFILDREGAMVARAGTDPGDIARATLT